MRLRDKKNRIVQEVVNKSEAFQEVYKGMRE
jgi:hypothetical protein